MYDAPAHSLILTKRDIATNAKLADARLTIRDAYGTTIDRWITTDGDHAIRVLPERSAAKDPHKNLLLLSDDTSEHVYTMVEELAPNGYLVAESITFKVIQMNDTLLCSYGRTAVGRNLPKGILPCMMSVPIHPCRL